MLAKVIRYLEPSDSGAVCSTRSVPAKSPVSWKTDPWLSHQVCAQQPWRASHTEMLFPRSSSGGSAQKVSSTARPPWIARMTLRPLPPSQVSVHSPTQKPSRRDCGSAGGAPGAGSIQRPSCAAAMCGVSSGTLGSGAEPSRSPR